MVGLVRMYIEPLEGIPEHISPEPYCPFIDAEEQDVHRLRKEWKTRGYDVICVPI